MDRRTCKLVGASLALCVVVGAAPTLAVESPAPLVSLPSTRPPPVWMRHPSGADFARNYPQRAARLGQAGSADMRCKITAAGLLVACVVLEEMPKGFGFGEAALRLSVDFKMRAAPGDTGSLEGATVNVPIRFNIGNHDGPHLSLNDGSQVLLVTPRTDKTPTRSLFKCPSPSDLHRMCESHLVQLLRGIDPVRASAILAKAGLNEGGSVLECQADASGELKDCRLGGVAGPAAEAAAIEWSSHLRVAPNAKDGTPTANGHVVFEINWASVKDLQATGAVAPSH